MDAAHNTNLQRLLAAVRAQAIMCAAGQAEDAKRTSCQFIAQMLPLSHADTCKSFEAICASGKLLSSNDLPKRLLRPRESKFVPAKEVLGTKHRVFFYVGPFRYPRTRSGMLFNAKFEESRATEISVIPFDSGGSVRHSPPPGEEDPRAFFERHRLPAPAYREFLGEMFMRFFSDPMDYVREVPPSSTVTLGLPVKQGDPLTWAFECQTNSPVEIRVKAHLEAVFVPEGCPPAVDEFLDWCKREDIPVVQYDYPWGADRRGYRALRDAGSQYVETMIQKGAA